MNVSVIKTTPPPVCTPQPAKVSGVNISLTVKEAQLMRDLLSVVRGDLREKIDPYKVLRNKLREAIGKPQEHADVRANWRIEPEYDENDTVKFIRVAARKANKR